MKKLLPQGSLRKSFALVLPLIMLPVWACSEQQILAHKPMIPLSAENVALKHKFRGVRGGELRVDATFETATTVILNVDTGYVFDDGVGIFSPVANSISSYGGRADGDRLPMPKQLRMIRYPKDARYLG